MVVNYTPKEVVELIKIRGFANTEEASIYLGLSIHYVRRLAREKTLSSFKPNGKCIYFKTEDLDNFLLGNKRIDNKKISQKAAKYIFSNR
ncbi:MAG: helix-turn-helix domain-containing protein [Flavobacterium sp.]|jgi:excisionase family DNA binding protein|uniref:helix-turn-helix domain-containing protein n=1 Tax=Flavobacterium sp. TaxID=239 RepID=UPI0022C0CC66|nr:helix-turn-helix domain-containing protein [Flavobacterium sp.]MCZ8330698.1 helix-turn-helix domain-containing protein [Flavobacterium sp.]